MDRRIFFTTAAAALTARSSWASDLLDEASAWPNLRAVVVAGPGGIRSERGFNGFTPQRPTNIKSASKSIISALAGMAIARGHLSGPDQPIAPLLVDQLPPDPDPRLAQVTVGHLLSMQTGLQRQSGPNYGAWVSSPNWVRHALAAPFVANPGQGMLYSTASTHLLSAVLTRVTGQSTLALARDWLAPLTGFRITGWDRDPQGIYLGGNQMAMSTRSLVAFGQLYVRRGRSEDGAIVLPESWIDASWTPRTRSVWSGHGYGYGWFMLRLGGAQAYYGWGYGGQMIYVIPSRQTTIAITSDPDRPSARTGYRDQLHHLAAALLSET